MSRTFRRIKTQPTFYQDYVYLRMNKGSGYLIFGDEDKRIRQYYTDSGRTLNYNYKNKRIRESLYRAKLNQALTQQQADCILPSRNCVDTWVCYN